MAAEEILPLFDLFWFQHAVFAEKPLLQTGSEAPENRFQSPVMQGIKVRSQSEYLPSSNFPPPETAYYSTGSITTDQKLQTILSGKVTEFSGNIERKPVEIPAKKITGGSESKRRRRKRGSVLSKSLSDLEFEELKGFMDLGFVFCEEDKNDSNLASIIPGLQRLGEKTGETEEKGIENGVSRPYLSEAWEAVDEENEKRILMKWRVPGLGATEMDMKDHLKFWAHTVASNVR